MTTENSASTSLAGAADYRAQRLANLERLEALGYAPYGPAYERTRSLEAVQSDFVPGRAEQLAGRLVARREMGKSLFATIQEGRTRLQIYLKRDEVGPEAFSAFRILDLGDWIGVAGALFHTRTGEPSLHAESWRLLSKSLAPLPEKWHGLQDQELRYRQRYLDLIANPEVRAVFDARSTAVRTLRAGLAARSFTEVETPMLQVMAGGAAAQPFRTHYQALNTDMFLRIAPELYLKRLLVGGYDRVFELNRNFRNEGLDRTHNPEFTMVEIYQAYGDAWTMAELVETLVAEIAQAVRGSLIVGAPDKPLDLTPPWRRVAYHDLIRERIGPDWFTLDLAAQRARALELGLTPEPQWDTIELTQEVFEKRIEKTLWEPTFVTRLPTRLVPLAKACADDPAVVDVFELIVAGQELAPGYSELNDPRAQRQRFLEQAGGDPTKLDEDFLAALEVGMPPAGGMGLGIDRLVMMLTGADSIRDVILFPHLRPRAAAAPE